MASKVSSSSIFQTLKRYIKKPWEITGPCADPEYRSALPKATEYRVRCPATTLQKPIVPTSDPETVFDIKYYTRDQRRDRPPIRRTILKKADVEKMMKEKTFDVNDFPKVWMLVNFLFCDVVLGFSLLFTLTCAPSAAKVFHCNCSNVAILSAAFSVKVGHLSIALSGTLEIKEYALSETLENKVIFLDSVYSIIDMFA
ncbi:hypothetical protein V6N13_013774 [Hibiscus sabdariffa]